MNVHQHARLTPQGRALMVRRVREEGWRVFDAAAAAGLSTRRAYEWLRQFRTSGVDALQDRRSAPGRSPHAVPSEVVAAIARLRRERRTGDAIARELDLKRSTVGVILRRLGLGRLAALGPKPPIVRYERAAPGELIHLDTKMLRRIAGVGHRITGHHAGMLRSRGIGWDHLHVAVDETSRLAYTEVLPSERQAGRHRLPRSRAPSSPPTAWRSSG